MKTPLTGYKLIVVAALLQGCTIDLELTSQRTALEKQIIGTFKQIDDDVILISSVRALDQKGQLKTGTISKNHQLALRAKQNQQFNADDLNEFKDTGLIGELQSGMVEALDFKEIRKRIEPSLVKIVDLVIKEENRDRMIIWQRMIELNPDLTSSNLVDIRKTYADQIWQSAKSGHWHQRQGKWNQKP